MFEYTNEYTNECKYISLNLDLNKVGALEESSCLFLPWLVWLTVVKLHFCPALILVSQL